MVTKALLMMGVYIVAHAIAADTATSSSSSSTSTAEPNYRENPDTIDESLPDCVCQNQWVNTNTFCNPYLNTAITSGIQMYKCPDLKTIQMCDPTAIKSYCYTTQDSCKQQVGSDMKGEGWSYCNAETEVAELPKCTCKSRWANSACNGTSTTYMMGCPTAAAMRQCDSAFDEEADQSWCETNEPICHEQEDSPNEAMVGGGWAYCDPDWQETELPVCECQASWSPDDDDCGSTGGSHLTFAGCPTIARISACDADYEAGDTQSWCKTTRRRCREQTYNVAHPTEDMRNESWAYCNPTSGEAELPECECMATWTHSENKCASSPLEMSGCPKTKDLARCDYDTEQSWCDTTFASCREQGSEAEGDGWSYCDADTGEAELPICECEGRWYNEEGACAAFSAVVPGEGLKKGLAMRGCPTLDQIQQCEYDALSSWCDTVDRTCKGQTDGEVGHGWVSCDPKTQRPSPKDNSIDEVVAAVAVSVVVTLTLVAFGLTLVIYLLAKRRHNQRKGFRTLVVDDQDTQVFATTHGYGS